MIDVMIVREPNSGVLAGLAKGVLRRKADELQVACHGRFTPSHGRMCRLHLDAYGDLTTKIAGLDAAIAPTQRQNLREFVKLSRAAWVLR